MFGLFVYNPYSDVPNKSAALGRPWPPIFVKNFFTSAKISDDLFLVINPKMSLPPPLFENAALYMLLF